MRCSSTSNRRTAPIVCSWTLCVRANVWTRAPLGVASVRRFFCGGESWVRSIISAIVVESLAGRRALRAGRKAVAQHRDAIRTRPSSMQVRCACAAAVPLCNLELRLLVSY